jgi:tetratricopeptide (TPR) repeat protein
VATSPGDPLNRRARAAWAERAATPVLVAVLTLVAYVPALRNGFVSWDDEKNFLANPHYRGLGAEQLQWMWTTFRLGHYIPLSWMTLGLDYVVWGMNPFGYHLTNVLLHAANAVLVYVLALRLLRRAADAERGQDELSVPAAFAALLFALHPLRVESVAWVTERRDVLSLLFALLSVLAYVRAADRDEHRALTYWISVGLFACALLSKATVMSLPAVLLILNIYPFRRMGGRAGWTTASARRVYLELVPFALLALAIAVLSIVALHPPDQLSPGVKVAVSAYSLAFYVWKTVAPFGLSPLYEMPRHVSPTSGVFIASYVAVVVLTATAWLVRRRWPWATVAWFTFVVISLPMLGAVQNGRQIAADRYTYHSAAALAMLGAGALLLAIRAVARPVVPMTVGAMVLAALGALTWSQIGVWHDSASLWARVLDVDANSAVAHDAWARLLVEQNKIDEGVAHGERAVTLAPEFAEAHNDLGVGRARQGRLSDAVAEYQRALALEPSFDEPLNNLGVVWARQGNLDSAIAHYRRAVEINPDNADAQVNWGNALVRLGRPDQAIGHYQDAIRIRPDHADAHHNWGVALARQGKFAEAIEQFRQTLAIRPDHAEAKEYLDRATQLLRGR